MPPLLSALIALVAGSVLGWLMLAGFCSVPGLTFSVVCGHNAYILLPIFIPLGIAISWFFRARISRSPIASWLHSKDDSHGNI
jgi:hypothetical protein